jgi:hypothetical protein
VCPADTVCRTPSSNMSKVTVAQKLQLVSADNL